MLTAASVGVSFAEGSPEQPGRAKCVSSWPSHQGSFTRRLEVRPAHQARPACFVLLDWWQDGYDLKQRYYTSPLDHPGELVELSGDAVGCVWELEVLLHERAAWIDHVLNSEADDFQAYLQDMFPRLDR